MATLMARFAGFAGAIGLGVLCGAVICEPARAVEALAFGTSAGLDPVLDLYNGGTLVATVSTSSALGIFQGFISNADASVIPSVGGPNGKNTSYAAGSYGGMLLVDYLGFNLASLPSTVTSITSATLVMESGKVTSNLTYTLFGASQWVSQLETPGIRTRLSTRTWLAGWARLRRLLSGRQNHRQFRVRAHVHAQRSGGKRHQYGDQEQDRICGRWPSLGCRRARALDLGDVVCRLRRTWRRCAPPRGQAPSRGLHRVRPLSRRIPGPGRLRARLFQEPVDREERGVWGAGRFGEFKRAVLRGDGSVPGAGEDRHDEDTPKGGEPGEEPAEIVSGGGEDGVGGVAMGAGEIVSAHAMLGLGVTDDRFDRRAAAEFTFDGFGDAASLAGDVDLELVIGRSVVAAIAAVSDDAGEVCADLRLDLRDHGRERVAVVGVAGQRLGVGDEQAAPGAMERGGERHLDAELVRAMGLAFADAFDLRRVQRIGRKCDESPEMSALRSQRLPALPWLAHSGACPRCIARRRTPVLMEAAEHAVATSRSSRPAD